MNLKSYSRKKYHMVLNFMIFEEVRNSLYWLGGGGVITFTHRAPSLFANFAKERRRVEERREIPIHVAYKSTNSQTQLQKKMLIANMKIFPRLEDIFRKIRFWLLNTFCTFFLDTRSKNWQLHFNCSYTQWEITLWYIDNHYFTTWCWLITLTYYFNLFSINLAVHLNFNKKKKALPITGFE